MIQRNRQLLFSNLSATLVSLVFYDLKCLSIILLPPWEIRPLCIKAKMREHRYERVRPSSHQHVRIMDRYASTTESILMCAYQVSGNYSDSSAAPLEELRRPSQSSSPPPSFRSRASSSRHQSPASLSSNNVNRTLADTFDDGVRSDEDEESSSDDRQRLMRSSGAVAHERILDRRAPTMERRRTEPSQFGSNAVCSAVADQARQNTPMLISYTSSNDGVFANLNAKPERGEEVEEHPPVS